MPKSGRTGAETRAEVQRVALALFGERGYDNTSLRDIAAAVGINKASLYYYFPGKAHILRSVLESRSAEARELAAWLAEQPRTPDLPRRVVLRWLDTFSVEKLHGVRVMNRNPLVLRALSTNEELGSELEVVARSFVDAPPREVVLIRMAFMSIATAAAAADGTGISDEETIRAARTAALALLDAAER